jgi:DNA-binding XRE family transcriptional regulator
MQSITPTAPVLIKTLRRALALTQEEFAARFRIPLGTLRDWEQGRSEPDQPVKPTSPSSRAIPKASSGHCIPCAANRRISTVVENLCNGAGHHWGRAKGAREKGT